MALSESDVLQRRLVRLETENEELKQKLSRYQHEVAMPMFPAAMRLSPQQRAILAMLMSKEWASHEAMLAGLPTWWAVDRRSHTILTVQVFRLRKKLAHLDVEINTIWGAGYSISSEHKARIRQYIEGIQ